MHSAPVIRHVFFVSSPDPQQSGICIHPSRFQDKPTTDEPQACADFNGQGLCFPIPIGPNGECVAVSNIKSLILPNNGPSVSHKGTPSHAYESERDGRPNPRYPKSPDCSVTDSGVGDLPGSGNIFNFNVTKSVEFSTKILSERLRWIWGVMFTGLRRWVLALGQFT
ncbi:hypothetical protein C8R44DRAFT_873624 [Mycena epipterygia]|nr:hypothetical protein C8R44DRAFT_873624 [Mycena epipterygia]